MFPSVLAMARAFPQFTCKTNKNVLKKRDVNIEVVLVGKTGGSEPNQLTDKDIECLLDSMYGVSLAARITDVPCSQMHTDSFIQVREVAAS